jgi:hypothetical protein
MQHVDEDGDREATLAGLRQQVRTESERLKGLRADVARAESGGPATPSQPVVHLGYVLGLVLGMPLWMSFIMLCGKR